MVSRDRRDHYSLYSAPKSKETRNNILNTKDSPKSKETRNKVLARVNTKDSDL